ncbi:MAG TPA: PAS domain-containing protein [Cytophagaceae bacterium]|jgi:PAS domain S-box-containing protein|nr:PAS domain-containing protein [Cytophagaceae bacterium]
MKPELVIETKLRNEKATKKLTWLYITALTAVALLCIVGQILIQNSINKLLSDSHVVNLAGRQRFKSQEIVKLCILISQNIEHPDYKDKPKDLKKLIDYWENAQPGLRNGSKELSLPGGNSEEVEGMFDLIDSYFQNILNGALSIYSLAQSPEDNREKMQPPLRRILANERLFLNGMDQIVHQYDLESKEKVLFLKNIENVLLLITLLILTMEGFFIFRPAVSKIRKTIVDLVLSEAKANDLARQLTLTNISLEKSLKDLRDINFALDYATILAKTDKYGIINYVNDKFCEISKYSKEEIIGSRFGIISGHYHSKTFFDKMWETISSGEVWNDEIKNKAKDGSVFWLDTTIVPVLNTKGIPISYIGIYADITQKFKQSINEQKIKTASVIEGQEKERKKIARELHDGLGQKLTALKFHIEGVKGAASKKEKERLEEIKKMLYDTIGEVRRISFNLMPSALNDFGIVPALKHLSEQVSKSSDVDVIFENNSTIERLNKTVEINLYRIVQEALNNAIKYSEADQINISLDNTGERFKILVADNGKGFSLASKGKSNGSGNGITNIQERTRLIDGEFSIETEPGMGTKILINIPYKH